MKTHILVRKLPLSANIGIHAWERTAPQPLLLDLECALPGDQACHSDRIRDTIDYDQLVDRVRALALERHYNLAEALAQRMTDVLMQEFKVPWIKLTLIKTAPLPGSEVGVTLERTVSLSD